MWDSYLNANYHSLQVAINKSLGNGLMLKGAYTWSKAINMTNDDGWAGVSWNSPQVFARNRARAGYDRTQIFQMGFVYQLPMGEGHSVANEGAAKWVLGDWEMSGIFSAYTGRPFSIAASSSSLNAPGNSQTADQVGEVRKLGNVGSDGTFYNPDAFAPVTEARFGTSGRDIIDSPGLVNLDLSIYKSFPITEKLKTQFRTEFYNLTNTPHFGRPNRSVTSSNFMRITSAYGDRQIRFALRFDF
jgi:hypothetical protein